jgi:hypothetical protein
MELDTPQQIRDDGDFLDLCDQETLDRFVILADAGLTMTELRAYWTALQSEGEAS